MNCAQESRSRFALVLAVLACAACALPAAAADSEFSDFRIPKHRWSTWVADFSGSGRTSHNEVTNQSAEDGALSGRLGSSAEWGFDSDRTLHRLRLTANLGGSRRHLERSLIDTLGRLTSDISVNDATETVAIEGSARFYPWRFPLGTEVSGSGEAAFGQSNIHVENNVFRPFGLASSHSRDEIDQNRQSVSGSLSIGMGRVRDATVVYRVSLIEQRLRDTGNLTRSLSAGAREKLAALFYVEKSFSIPHDRPGKFFWREVERILRDDGALESDALDAYAVYRVIEPVLAGSAPARRAGFFVGPFVFVNDVQGVRRESRHDEFTLFENDSVIRRGAATRSSRASSHRAFVGVGGQAEYHLPVDLRWQFDASSHVRYADESNYFQIGSSATITWLIADRWHAGGWVYHSWNRQGSTNERKDWAAGYGGTLSYYIEDAWQLGIAWDGGNRHRDEQDGGHDDSNQQFTLGISYHIAGSLDVPGVVDPVRMRANQ